MTFLKSSSTATFFSVDNFDWYRLRWAKQSFRIEICQAQLIVYLCISKQSWNAIQSFYHSEKTWLISEDETQIILAWICLQYYWGLAPLRSCIIDGIWIWLPTGVYNISMVLFIHEYTGAGFFSCLVWLVWVFC